MLLFLFFSVSFIFTSDVLKNICTIRADTRMRTEKIVPLHDDRLTPLHPLFVASSFSSGFERRPLKHPACPDGTERDPPKPPRTGTVPALVPKPPSYPLVKLVGKFYTLKCRWVNCVCWSRASQPPRENLNVRNLETAAFIEVSG